MDGNNLLDLNGNRLPNPKTFQAIYRAFYNSIHSRHRFGTYQDLNFKALMAFARDNDIKFVSLSRSDLIAGNSIRKPKSTGFDHLFAWRVCDALGFPGSCGNGINNEASQKQMDGTMLFGERYFAIWDPKTETKICDNPFTLHSNSIKIGDFKRAIDQGRMVDFLENDPYMVEHHPRRV